HLDDFGRRSLRGRVLGASRRRLRGCGLVPAIGGGDGVTGDFLLDLDGHDAFPGIRGCRGLPRPRGRDRTGYLPAAFPATFRGAALRAGAFFAAAFFAGAFFAAAFFTTAFFVVALRVTALLAPAFFATAFFAAAFFTTFFAAFFAAFLRLSAAASALALALVAASEVLALATRVDTAFFAAPAFLSTAFFARVADFTTAFSALPAAFFAFFTAVDARLDTAPPTAFALPATTSAAAPSVVATPLPLLIVFPSSSCWRAGRPQAECSAPGTSREPSSELSVVALFQGVEQVGRGVGLAVVLDFLVAAGLDRGPVLELEAVGGVGEVGLLHQHALEGGGVEAEGGAALQPLLVGVEVDVLEVLVGIVGRDVGGLGD